MKSSLCVIKIVKKQCEFVIKHKEVMSVGQAWCAQQQKGEKSWQFMI
jgi:hypothetical protein